MVAARWRTSTIRRYSVISSAKSSEQARARRRAFTASHPRRALSRRQSDSPGPGGRDQAGVHEPPHGPLENLIEREPGIPQLGGRLATVVEAVGADESLHEPVGDRRMPADHPREPL